MVSDWQGGDISKLFPALSGKEDLSIGNIQIFRFLEGRKINNFSHIGSIFHKVSYSLYVSINRCLWNTYIIKPLIYYCLWYNFIIIRYFCKISVKRRQVPLAQKSAGSKATDLAAIRLAHVRS